MARILQKYKWLVFIFTLPLLIIFISFVIQKLHIVSNHTTKNAEPDEVQIIHDKYGIEFENYIVYAGVVQNRQTLSHILGQFNLDNVMVDRIVSEMREFFDPRRIRAGNTFHAYNSPDSLDGLKYFVYDISSIEFLMVDLTDSLTIYRGEKKVTNVAKTASGIINSSLWVTMTQNNLNPELAIKMSEILAWEIDFHRIHRGDRFKVVYEEGYVGDESVGIGRVDAIYFNHQGREVYGFKFEKDTVDGYFNHEGENLRKVFLKSPIKFGRISSGFSSSRLHPVLRVRRPHHGTDYAAPMGTPILAVGDGVVIVARFNSSNGNYVRIRHNSVYETQYLHMSGFAQGIRPGKSVKQGDVIGYVGMTGLATGPHVCFRFWKNGHQVNHLREEFPSADPLHKDFHEEFHLIRDYWMRILEGIDFKEEHPV